MRSFITFLLLLTAFLIPLLSPVKNLGYEQTKVFFFIISVTICGLLWNILSFREKVTMEWTSIQKAALLFIAILFLTSYFGVDRWNSFLGTQVYFQGWVLYAYFFLFFLLVVWTKIKLEYWALCMAGSASIVGFLAVGEWIQINLLGHQLPTYAGRVVSTFGQPNFYSGFLLLTLPFFYYLLKRKNQNWFLIPLGFLINILAIVLSESRIAFILLSLLIVVFLLWELPRKRLLMIICGFFLLISFVLAFIFGAGFLEKEFIEIFKINNPDTTKIGVERRYYFWQIIGKLIMESPLLGYGLENIGVTFSQYFVTNKHTIFEENLQIKPFMFGLRDLNVDRSHNYVLDLLLFSGILGLIGWLILVIMIFKKIRQMSSDRTTFILTTSLIVYLIWIQFQNQSVVHLLYFWLLVGLIDKG